jgi:hypothetical protein
MATNQHGVVKPQKIVDLATGMLEQELVIPNLFQKEGVDNFKGTENDTYNVKVEGVLPFHDYEFRSGSTGTSSNPYNGRQKVVFDLYEERTYPVQFQGRVYNGVAITDEQADFDLDRWGKLLAPQVKAVARGLQRRAVSTLTGQTYPVVIGDAAADLRGSLLEARRVMNKFNVPTEGRYIVVGSDVEALILSDPNLALTAAVSDARAESALAEASIGRLFGFNIIVDQTIAADEAYAFAGNGFIFLNAAPSIPASKAGNGATQSLDGISLRWLTSYDDDYFVDRSTVDTYAGFRSVQDVLVGWNPILEKEVVSVNEHFVRGVKIVLDGASTYPALGTVDDDNDGGTTPAVALDWNSYEAAKASGATITPSQELALITGVTAPGAHLTGAAATVADD